jgi:hypothetical protein
MQGITTKTLAGLRDRRAGNSSQLLLGKTQKQLTVLKTLTCVKNTNIYSTDVSSKMISCSDQARYINLCAA